MRYGFTAQGFWAIDDERRVAEFAYATSPHWDAAKRDAKKTAAAMLEQHWKACPADIRERAYLHGLQEMPKPPAPRLAVYGVRASACPCCGALDGHRHTRQNCPGDASWDYESDE